MYSIDKGVGVKVGWTKGISNTVGFGLDVAIKLVLLEMPLCEYLCWGSTCVLIKILYFD